MHNRQAEMTDLWVRTIRTDQPREEWRDARQPNLELRVTGNGTKTWRLHYTRSDGRRKAVKIGSELEQVKAANRDPSAKERRSLQMMVAAMVSRHYDFSPGASRNLATKAIVDDASLLGLSIDKDTVLSHLRQAYQALGIKGAL